MFDKMYVGEYVCIYKRIYIYYDYIFVIEFGIICGNNKDITEFFKSF